MTYNYSICHPDKEEIEHKAEVLSAEQVLQIAKNYPWLEQLELSKTLEPDKVFYSPSLGFKCIENNIGLELTADYNDEMKLQFSIWFTRPKKVKVLFGLLGEKEKMVVDDYWSLNPEDTLNYLAYFVEGNYAQIESLYEK